MTCPVCAHVTTSRRPLFCAKCGHEYPAARERPSRLEHAGFLVRAKALAIDYAILSCVIAPLALYLFPPHALERQLVLQGPLARPNDFVLTMLSFRLLGILGITVLIMFAYQTLMTASALRGSFGKSLMKLAVVDLMGRRLNLARAAWREVCKTASIVPGHLGFLWVVIDKKKQGFHDKIAGTLVVLVREEEDPQPGSPDPPAPPLIPEAPAPSRTGQRAGDYSVDSLLFEDSFGAVYRGRSVSGAPVTIRFARRRHAAAIRPESDVPSGVIDTGIVDGWPYVVLAEIDGLPVHQHCRVRRPEAPEIVALFAQACDAVAEGHDRKLLHGDLKPESIVVTGDGRVIVTGFGVAAALNGDLPPRAFTFPYAAPERVGGEAMDARSDVYSLGAVLYELLTGSPLMAEPRAEPAMRDHARRQMIRTARIPNASLRTEDRELRVWLRLSLDAILEKALARDPRDRYASAREFAAALRAPLSRPLHRSAGS